jgi:NAD(P)-dependent dehydrogenase (short-subunit alcohol dehydrogenase family)
MSSNGKLLYGKRIVVVGGAGLLGSRISEALISEGALCVIADLSLERAGSIAETIWRKCGIRPKTLWVSIVDKDSVDTMIAQCCALIGGVDGLVNTAYPRNRNYGKKFEEVTYDDFCENLSLHFGGYFLVSQRILEHFKRSGGGVLLNMSSIYGVVAPKFGIYEGTDMTMPVEYAAIKAGLIHITKYMAKYYAGSNIRVNCLSLGGLNDGQNESFIGKYRDLCINKGMLDPEDIVGTVVFALSDGAKYLNGQNLIVDDGFTL